MKALVVALVFFLLGALAFWGFREYQEVILQNQDTSKQTTAIPATAGEEYITPTRSPEATIDPEAKGSISGYLSYPSELIPSLEVYAININDLYRNFKVVTMTNQTEFTITGIDPDTYYVVAYPKEESGHNSGSYTKAVDCGLSILCNDHTMIPVVVGPGQNVIDIKVKDWYAPEGTFPQKP